MKHLIYLKACFNYKLGGNYMLSKILLSLLVSLSSLNLFAASSKNIPLNECEIIRGDGTKGNTMVIPAQTEARALELALLYFKYDVELDMYRKKGYCFLTDAAENLKLCYAREIICKSVAE